MVVLSAEEQIIQAIEAELAKVTVANGYQTDVGAEGVHRWSPAPGATGPGPKIYIENAGSSQAPKDLRLSQTEARVIHFVLQLDLPAIEEADARMSAFIADVYRTLTDDVQLGGTVLNLEIGDVARALAKEQGRVAAFALMECDVFYRHVIDDPFTVSPATP